MGSPVSANQKPFGIASRPEFSGDSLEWGVYEGSGEPHDGIDALPPAPPWRTFDGGPLIEPQFSSSAATSRRLGGTERARTYRADPWVVEMVNTALLLRRPLLVTGKPGTGKSTLAHSVAYELRLGPVLPWWITSRSNLAEGLYRYDGIGRLQEASLHLATESAGGPAPVPDIGRYIHLGPLGTALLPQARPRVLLIDEMDKSDIDLPSDLLHVFEEGQYEIPELARLPEELDVVDVMTADSTERVPVRRGLVRCYAFPLVVITSNAERESPPAFLRRCLRLDIKPPDRDRLASIVAAQLGAEAVAASDALIGEFLERRERGDLATDQLLNAIYIATSGSQPVRERIIDSVLRPLDTTGA